MTLTKLSSITNDEYYCDQIVQITKSAIEKTIQHRNQLSDGKQTALKALMEALVVTGIAMSFARNSRPASGSEHHISHFWEMRYLLEGKAPVLHGTKVGIATVLIAELYQRLLEEKLTPEMIANISPPDTSNWMQDINSVFLAAAPEVILLEEQTQKNSVVDHKKRIQVIAKHWLEIEEVLGTLPKPECIIDLLKSAHAPTDPAQVGIGKKLVQEAILYAKEIRPRYTILQLLWDLDLLSDYAFKVSTLEKA